MPTGNGEIEASLKSVFPGQTVVLSNGNAVTVRPWSAWDVLHRIPAQVGTIAAAVMPVFRGAADSPELMQARVPSALAAASDTIASIIAHETGLTDADLRLLRGADVIKIARAVIEQNLDFFGEIEGLRKFATEELTGHTSPPS